MESLLNIFLERLPHGFLSQPNLAQLGEVARCLPPLSGALLEVHLGEETHMDLALRVTRAERPFLHTLSPSLPLTLRQRLATFATAWDHPPLATGVENIGLEFDMDGQGVGWPSLFFDVDRAGEMEPAPRLGEVAARWHIITLMHHIFCDTPAPPYLADIIHGLGEQARYYVGFMLGRAETAVRLSLSHLAAPHIAPTLAQLAWPGNLNAVQQMLALAPDADRWVVDLDVGQRLYESLGLEIFYEGRGRDERWHRLWQRLVAANLCTPTERQALLNWPIYQHISPIQMPIFQAINAQRDKPVKWLHWRINHIKLTITPPGKLKAKAYLYTAYA
jgi:hypothetical protein